MGRLLLLILLIAAAIVVWKAFGPATWKRNNQVAAPAPIKGPDDDEQFLWELEKKQFKKKREKQKAEELARQEEAIERARQRFHQSEPGTKVGPSPGQADSPDSHPRAISPQTPAGDPAAPSDPSDGEDNEEGKKQ